MSFNAPPSAREGQEIGSLLAAIIGNKGGADATGSSEVGFYTSTNIKPGISNNVPTAMAVFEDPSGIVYVTGKIGDVTNTDNATIQLRQKN